MNEHEIVFTRQQLNALRQTANQLWMQAEYLDVEEGWSRSKVDISAFMQVFEGIHCHPDMAVYAFQFREGDSGNGLLLACPKEQSAEWVLEHLKQDQDVSHCFLEKHFWAMVDGWGPMALLLFLKEAGEFGAFGHGISWQEEELIDDALWNSGEVPVSFLGEPFNKPLPELWQWRADEPVDFNPVLKLRENSISAELYTMSYRENYYLRRYNYDFDKQSGRLLTREVTIVAGIE